MLFLLSSFLVSLDTCLQVLFKHAMLYVGDVISSICLASFSISLVVGIYKCFFRYSSWFCSAFVHPLLRSVSYKLSTIYDVQTYGQSLHQHIFHNLWYLSVPELALLVWYHLLQTKRPQQTWFSNRHSSRCIRFDQILNSQMVLFKHHQNFYQKTCLLLWHHLQICLITPYFGVQIILCSLCQPLSCRYDFCLLPQIIR